MEEPREETEREAEAKAEREAEEEATRSFFFPRPTCTHALSGCGCFEMVVDELVEGKQAAG